MLISEDVRMLLEARIHQQSRLSKHVRVDPTLVEEVITTIIEGLHETYAEDGHITVDIGINEIDRFLLITLHRLSISSARYRASHSIDTLTRARNSRVMYQPWFSSPRLISRMPCGG
jgi:hypothetical protein